MVLHNLVLSAVAATQLALTCIVVNKKKEHIPVMLYYIYSTYLPPLPSLRKLWGLYSALRYF